MLHFTMSLDPAAKNIQSLYLNPDGADVWFKINDERIPGHKLILSSMCAYYKTMFYGSLPENNEVNMTEAVKSAESFKEFLKFMYMRQPNLTMYNIEDVTSLAKQSLSYECLSACEMYLKKSLTRDSAFRIYQLALLYDMDHLKAICEDEICVFAEKVLKSSSLLEFPYEYLQMILQRDALACEEIDIFNACIAWAKAACKQNSLDPLNAKNLRAHLGGIVHQIRFTSMTKEEASHCIQLYPGLFTADELEEIICMVALQGKFQPKQFNWTPRYYNLNWYQGRKIEFSRVIEYNECKSQSAVNKCETTRFSCNRYVLLHGFYCQIDAPIKETIQVIIKESRNNENEIDRCDQQFNIHFNVQINKKPKKPFIHQAEIVLNKSILLRPKYHYDICIKFESNYIYCRHNYCIFETKKRIDHDIVFDFDNTGIVSGLSVYRFDNKNYFEKMICNPKTWKWMVLASAVFVAFLSIRSSSSTLPIGPVSQPDDCLDHSIIYRLNAFLSK